MCEIVRKIHGKTSLERRINKGKNEGEGRNETSVVKDIDTSFGIVISVCHEGRNETSVVKDIDTLP